MKVGELVRIRDYVSIQNPRQRFGIIVRIDDSHRQTTADVLSEGGIKKEVWEGHLVVIE